MGMPYPEKEGGAGADYVSYVIAIEELSRACATTGIIVSAHNSLATWPIFKFGTRAQKDQYLHDMTSGRRLGAFALTEPGRGNRRRPRAPPRRRRTRTGTPSTDRRCSSPTHRTPRCTSSSRRPTRTTGTRGISAFIVEKDTPGFSVGEAEHKMGIRGSSTPPIYFSDCRVPKEALLGEEGDGFKIAMATLDGGRIGISAQALGIAQAALDASVAYAKERVQFGKPIANLQAIQWMIADMATEIDAARLLVYRAACAWTTAGLIPQRARWPSSSRRRWPPGWRARRSRSTADTATRRAYPVERNYRDAKITELYEGTSEVQRMVIARNALR